MIISTIRNRTDTEPTQINCIWEELSDSLGDSRELTWDSDSYWKLKTELRGNAKDGPAWIPGDCKPGERRDSSVGSIWCVVLDFDSMRDSDVPELWRIVGKYLCLAHTTASHGEKPKWRVVFPLSSPVMADKWRGFWSDFVWFLNLTGRLAPDRKAINPSRLYYLPAHLRGVEPGLIRFRGAMVDPIKVKTRPKFQPRPAPTLTWETTGDAAQRYARAALRKVGPAVEGAGGDSTTFRAACMILRDFGFSRSEGMQLLREWNSTCSPPWTDEELEEKADHAMAYGKSAIGSRRPVRLSKTKWDLNAVRAFIGSKS